MPAPPGGWPLAQSGKPCRRCAAMGRVCPQHQASVRRPATAAATAPRGSWSQPMRRHGQDRPRSPPTVGAQVPPKAQRAAAVPAAAGSLGHGPAGRERKQVVRYDPVAAAKSPQQSSAAHKQAAKMERLRAAGSKTPSGGSRARKDRSPTETSPPSAPPSKTSRTTAPGGGHGAHGNGGEDGAGRGEAGSGSGSGKAVGSRGLSSEGPGSCAPEDKQLLARRDAGQRSGRWCGTAAGGAVCTGGACTGIESSGGWGRTRPSCGGAEAADSSADQRQRWTGAGSQPDAAEACG